MRQTKQREALLHLLQHSEEHPTAEMVYQDLKQTLPNVSLATVYRLLNTLVEQGEISLLRMEDGPNRYDGTRGKHHHVVCTLCGRVVDVPNLIPEGLLKELERWTGFQNVTLKMGWSGTCTHCTTDPISLS